MGNITKEKIEQLCEFCAANKHLVEKSQYYVNQAGSRKYEVVEGGEIFLVDFENNIFKHWFEQVNFEEIRENLCSIVLEYCEEICERQVEIDEEERLIKIRECKVKQKINQILGD